MNLSCLVIDDEYHAIDLLSKFIDRTPGLTLAGAENNPLEALEKLDNKALNPDLTFLDIDMPQISGLQVAGLIGIRSEIIFTTAFPQYAVDAFNKNALDYLLKPFTYDRFLKTVGKAREKYMGKATIGLQPQNDDHFFAKSGIRGKIIRLKYTDILYIEAKANYLDIHLSNESHLVYLSLKEMEDQLQGKEFMRVHKSFIVNLQKVKALEGNIIRLDQGKSVDLGTSYREPFLETINPKLVISKRRS